MKIKEKILGLIDKDIEFQKTFIVKEEKESSVTYEKNKPFRWRIEGMEALKKKINLELK